MLRPSRQSYRLGYLFGCIHFAYSLAVLIPVINRHDAQWQLVWIRFLFIDFPISLLTLLGMAFCPEWDFGFLPYPFGDARDFIFPVLVHVGLGSLYYFTIPISLSVLIQWLKQRVAKSSKKHHP